MRNFSLQEICNSKTKNENIMIYAHAINCTCKLTYVCAFACAYNCTCLREQCG